MGPPVNFRGTLEERLARNIVKDQQTGCWNWQGGIVCGYGSVFHERKTKRVHRVVWQLNRGPIPTGLELDHLCRNRRCCNPDHLEPVTRSENALRSPLVRRPPLKTHCPQGHEYSPENTLVRKNGGGRTCRICARAHGRKSRMKSKMGVE